MRTLHAAPPFRSSVASWRLPALVTMLTGVTLSGGMAALLRQQQSADHEAGYSIAAAFLLITAAVQASMAWRHFRLGRRRLPAVPLTTHLKIQTNNRPDSAVVPSRAFVVRLIGQWLSGLVVCYLVAVFTGPGPTAPYVFAAGAMAWLTVLFMPFAAPPEAMDRWRRLLQGLGSRRFSRFAYIALMAGVLGELSLRANEWFSGAMPLDSSGAANPERLTSNESSFPGSGEQSGSSSSDWSGFRVAVVGDELTLAAAGPNGALGRLESALPAIKIFNLSAPLAGPREYASQGMRQARRLNPDLILTFVSIADDIAPEPQRQDLFDWHALRSARLLMHCAGLPNGPIGPTETSKRGLVGLRHEGHLSADDWDAYVAACGPELTVCRKPINAAMQQRWRLALKYFDDLAETCQGAGIPLALVIVPSPLQTNRPLLDAICRREGCGLTDVDVELPQRRLAAYAADRRVPLFDLLPVLRMSREQPYVHRGWHWNDAGNEAAAQALTGWLQSTFATTLATRRPELGPLSATSEDGSLLVARRQ